MKKITVISSYFAPAWAYGGPPQVLFTLAKEFVKLGIAINVITTDSLGDSRNRLLHENIGGIKVFRFKNLSNTLAYRSNFFFARLKETDVEKILSDTDAVLFSDLRSIFNWQLYRYVKEKNIPYGIFAFGEIPYGGGIKSLVKKIFDVFWVRDFITNAKWLFAQTQHEKKMYGLYFGLSEKRIDLLPLPVEKSDEKPDWEKITKFRKKWGIKTDDKVIIFVGRINYLKGIDILINSCQNLLKSDSRIKLLIVGRDDGYLSKLKNIIKEDVKRQIIFTGPLYGQKVNLAYGISSCFVITPRFFEETATASLEAMIRGVPVVITKEAEIPYFWDYNGGFMVDNKLSDISYAINKILSFTPKEREETSNAARRCIQNHFMGEKVTKQLVEILLKK